VFHSKAVEKIKTHFLFNYFFSPENNAVYEIRVDPNRPHMTIRRIIIAVWINVATNTHSEYVILIAFPLQQRLQERASMLRYTYVACLVFFYGTTT